MSEREWICMEETEELRTLFEYLVFCLFASIRAHIFYYTSAGKYRDWTKCMESSECKRAKNEQKTNRAKTWTIWCHASQIVFLPQQCTLYYLNSIPCHAMPHSIFGYVENETRKTITKTRNWANKKKQLNRPKTRIFWIFVCGKRFFFEE